MSGKWHVTPKKGPNLKPGDQTNWPVNRGFDQFFGTIHGAGSFWDPNSLARGLQLIAPDDDFYYTDAIADNAVRFISEHNSAKPFFMYVAFTCPHWPMHAREQDIAKYQGTLCARLGCAASRTASTHDRHGNRGRRLEVNAT